MAIKTWAALASNELVAHAEVENAVSNGELAWSGSNPGLADGYCYTRDDFETYLRHSDMSASGIASGECMSKAEMETYRVVAAVTSTTPIANDAVGNSFNAQVQFSHVGAESVRVERSISGGAYSQIQIVDTSPAGGTSFTNTVNCPDGGWVTFRLTPYTGNSASGTAGAAVTRQVDESHI